MQVFYSLLGSAIIAIIVSWVVTWYFSRKAKNLQKDLSELIIRQITKNPNNLHIEPSKNGKHHVEFDLELKDGFIANAKPNADIKKNNNSSLS